MRQILSLFCMKLGLIGEKISIWVKFVLVYLPLLIYLRRVMNSMQKFLEMKCLIIWNQELHPWGSLSTSSRKNLFRYGESCWGMICIILVPQERPCGFSYIQYHQHHYGSSSSTSSCSSTSLWLTPSTSWSWLRIAITMVVCCLVVLLMAIMASMSFDTRFGFHVWLPC